MMKVDINAQFPSHFQYLSSSFDLSHMGLVELGIRFFCLFKLGLKHSLINEVTVFNFSCSNSHSPGPWIDSRSDPS
jgi:hypothetical protein